MVSHQPHCTGRPALGLTQPARHPPTEIFIARSGSRTSPGVAPPHDGYPSATFQPPSPPATRNSRRRHPALLLETALTPIASVGESVGMLNFRPIDRYRAWPAAMLAAALCYLIVNNCCLRATCDGYNDSDPPRRAGHVIDIGGEA